MMDEALSGYACCAKAPMAGRELHARYYKAHLDFCKEYGYDALAVSCWPQMQDLCGSYSCSIVGKLNQNGIPAACEGDLPGAVSMLLQKYLAERPTTLMDLSAMDEQTQSMLLWHCGPTPESYANHCGAELRNVLQPAGEGNITDRVLIIDMVFNPQHVTVMRIGGDWNRMFLLDGDVLPEEKSPSRGPIGSRGWIGNLRLNRKPIAIKDLMNTILVGGMEHHFPMMTGDITEETMEVAAWLGLPMMESIPYENYLQVR